MKLTFFQLMKNAYYDSGKSHSNSMNVLFGAISGTLAVTIYYPVDLIRKRFQASVSVLEIIV
jgi:Mitochondrial carrier protein.